MFNGRSAAANGAEKSFTPEREAFLIFSREKDNTFPTKARHVIFRSARRGWAEIFFGFLIALFLTDQK
jgi:hypothetical protein